MSRTHTTGLKMYWTWQNLIVGLIGIVAITGCCFLIRHRVVVLKFIVRENTEMYGRRVGARLGRTSETWVVVVPAVFGIAIGTVFILGAIFGHPQ